MMWRSLLLSCLVSLVLFSVVTANNVTEKQAPKGRFAVFNVVKFPNDGCSGSNNRNGTCYTDAECTSRSGTASGSCAEGYGVCCTFELNCGQKSSENCTYVSSEGTETGYCQSDICSVNNNICQLRLDFETFVINQPSTSTNSINKHVAGVVAGAGGNMPQAIASQCATDSFVVKSETNSPAAICGTATGEHMYVDITRGGCASMVFTLGTGATVTSRQWTIKVSQYDCGYENRAPQGCTKYYFGESGAGTIKSYNFDSGMHLANQEDTMCIRRERGNCRICYTTTTGPDFATSGDAMSSILVGASSKCCGYGMDGITGLSYDCVQIPGASKKTGSTLIAGNEFCGGAATKVATGGLATASGNANIKTVCTKVLPFKVTFLSDNWEEAAIEAVAQNSGIKLTYAQSTC